jgi:hypothetical protein
MSLVVKDGAGSTTALNTSYSGGEHTPYHAISGTVEVKSRVTTNFSRTKFHPGNSSIDWASTGSSTISGTFVIAETSSVRTALMFANNTSVNLYVAVGDGLNPSTNGFALDTTASAPTDYSFIVYPSGTYTCESSLVNAKFSGFFPSSSAPVALYVVRAE